MAPQQRSQALAPRVSIPPRTSLRKRIPTARAAASVAAPRGKGKGGDKGGGQTSGEAPSPINDLVGGTGEEATPTPRLPILRARHVGSTSKIYQRKDKER